MKVTADCIPCFLKTSLRAMAKGGWPEERREEVLLSLLPLLSSLDNRKTPAENATLVLYQLVKTMGGVDPFKEAKTESNQRALQHLPSLRKMISQSADPLELAVKFAAAGNVVDLGIFDEYDLTGAISEALETGFAINDYSEFKERVGQAEKLLIIGDNSGEIVFDRLLVEALIADGKKVVYGVKGGFVLNDSTIADALETGMTDICPVITNGNQFLGTIAEKCSEEFLKVFREADIVISKGQANYYTLEGTGLAGNKTFFLLKAKCNVVAKDIGVHSGGFVFLKNKVS